MGATPRRLGGLLVALALLAAPIWSHFAVMTHRGVALAGVLIAVQAGMLGWVSMATAAARAPIWMRGAVALVLCGATVAIWQATSDGLMLASAVPHATAYLGLLIVFAASLAPGREALITVVARRSRGSLNDALLVYTRRVTLAWCLFFAAQLLISLVLWLFAPISWWSVFVNLCTLPAVLLMFGAELLVRHLRHGIHRPAQAGRFGQMLQALGQIRAPAGVKAKP